MFELALGDGYPFPYPTDSDEELDAIIEGEMAVEDLILKGVDSLEWRFEWTIQFVDQASYDAAKAATGWEAYDAAALILSITLSGSEGRDGMPALIVGDKAYCRWMLRKGEA